MNIYWKDKVSNEELYNRAEVKEWSSEIKKRRLKWLGHLLRLPKEIPTKQAVHQVIPIKRPRGKPNATWVNLIRKEMAALNINFYLQNFNQILTLANDRAAWNNLVDRTMSQQDKKRN